MYKLNKLGFTGLIDLDKLIIMYLSLKDLREIINTNKYLQKLTEESILELPKILLLLNKYERLDGEILTTKDKTKILAKILLDIADFTIDLLKNNKLDLARKIVNYIEVNDLWYKLYDEYFYQHVM